MNAGYEDLRYAASLVGGGSGVAMALARFVRQGTGDYRMKSAQTCESPCTRNDDRILISLTGSLVSSCQEMQVLDLNLFKGQLGHREFSLP